MKKFLTYIITNPVRRGGPDRLDYITVAALMPVACIGSGISRALFPATTTGIDIATGAAGGVLAGLTYLYIAYRIRTRRQDKSTEH